MGSKRQMTQAKMARERDVKEKRARKLERRAERKRAAAEGATDPATTASGGDEHAVDDAVSPESGEPTPDDRQVSATEG